jgi:hypothetical protein
VVRAEAPEADHIRAAATLLSLRSGNDRLDQANAFRYGKTSLATSFGASRAGKCPTPSSITRR